jgi:hypothetical protein
VSLTAASTNLTTAANAIASDTSATSLVASTTSVTSPSSVVNQASSVLYWGYWKKEGESDPVAASAATTPTVAGGTAGISSATNATTLTSGVTGATGSIAATKNAPISILQSIAPPASQMTVGSSGTSGTGIPKPLLTGAALESALSAQVQGYKALGWKDAAIVSYFFTPGKPGYIQYPGLTVDEFVTATEGILAPATIAALESPNKGNTKK